MSSAEYILLIENGDILGALSTAITNLLPLGFAWIIIGLAIFGVIQNKTKSYGVSGLILVIYLSLLIPMNFVDYAVQPFLALFIGILITVMLLKIIK